jgi:hypothetical protein
MNDYRVFGLKVRSEIPLPELIGDDAAGEPDICIVRGTVGASPALGDLQVNGGAATLLIPEVAQYRIEHGCRITVDAAAGAPEANVRLYLLGSAFGALLHQRRLLLLHANGVEVDGRAIAFSGESGAGKSTLAAWFHDHGYRVLADDVCAVDMASGEQPLVRPGIARLRLWREVLTHTGREPGDYQQSFVGDATLDKFDVPLRNVVKSTSAFPLAAICLLERGDSPHVERIGGVAAVEAVYANTYRGRFITKVGSSSEHWSAVVKLAQHVPVLRVTRRWGLDAYDAEARALLDRVDESLRT